jgi:hypothetical protein
MRANCRVVDVKSTSKDAYAIWSPACASRIRLAEWRSCSAVTARHLALKVLRTAWSTSYSDATRTWARRGR